MPSEITADSVEELVEALGDCGSRKQSVELGGNFTKRAMGGGIAPADIILSTHGLERVLAYEPHDLTISVEAGLPFRELQQVLEAKNQMLPLDPPFAEEATIGGVVATNSSGPRRRKYGTARDMIIGMKMATLEGKAFESGGMVVKNVSGLDMAKLMVGSFGTLAAIASINFKVFAKPEVERTFVCASESLNPILELRSTILGSVLQPVSIDILNPEAARETGSDLPAGYLLALEAAGNLATVDRYEREFGQLAGQAGATHFSALGGEDARNLWQSVQGLTSRSLRDHPTACVVQVSTTPARLGDLFHLVASLDSAPPVVARGGAAVAYVHSSSVGRARTSLENIRAAGMRAVLEYAPPDAKDGLTLWSHPGAELDIMRRVKHTLDPNGLLNRGRLFNQI